MPKAPPPQKFIREDGKMIRNPEHIAYMRDNVGLARKRNDGEMIDEEAEAETGRAEQEQEETSIPQHQHQPEIDSDGIPIPQKYIRRRGKMILNPSYVSYMKGTPSLSTTSTKLNAVTDLIDLSDDFCCVDPEFPMRSLHCNPGARWIESCFGAMNEVRRVTVIENGRLVADFLNGGVEPDDTFNLFSTTKGVLSMILGAVIDRTDLTVDDTLGEIFQNNPHAWKRLEDHPDELAYTKSIKLEELLTMTSGLESMLGGTKGILSMKELSVADAPGSDLPRALAAPGYDPTLRGKFHYMPSSNILSYVILEKTGLSPGAFAHKHVFPKLGISKSSMSWETNSDGVETSYSQLHLTTHHMCKIGQLYLQDGYPSPRALRPLLADHWIEDSHSRHVHGEGGFDHWYGYLWALYDRSYHGNQQVGDIWCAPGFNGQLIAISRETQRVVAISRTPIPMDGETLADFKKSAIRLLSKTMSFEHHASNASPGNSTTATGGDGDEIIPDTYIRKNGRMVRNPAYIEYMKRKHPKSKTTAS
jgi:CubicO group peptidase (beta-lactamase class C family)